MTALGVPEVSRDAFWHGRLAVWQPARGHGYRFNLDPVALARFCPAAETAIELGTGCGILSLLLVAAGKARAVTAVEVQPELACLARRNAADNRFGERMTVLEGDLRSYDGPPADLVAFNPPYFRAREGRASPHPGRDAARREQHGTLADFVACARRWVTPLGTVAVVIPVARDAELRQLAALAGLHVCASQAVTARAEASPHLTLIAFSPTLGATAPRVLPPLALHAGAGRAFSEEMVPWVEGSVAATTGLWP